MPYRPIRTIIKDQKLITCAGSTTVVEASQLMRVNQIGALMIVDEGRLAGIFTERDALFRVIANERDAKTTQPATACSSRQKRFCNRADGSARPARSGQSATK